MKIRKTKKSVTLTAESKQDSIVLADMISAMANPEKTKPTDERINKLRHVST